MRVPFLVCNRVVFVCFSLTPRAGAPVQSETDSVALPPAISIRDQTSIDPLKGRVWLDEKFFAHVFREENLVRMEY